MGEEEKQAIEYFKNYSIWNQSQGFPRGKNDSAIETVLNLIEKKDKIIDEMAEYIDLLDIDEDICKNVKDKNCDEENLGRCVDCIKEYFKKKVEDD